MRKFFAIMASSAVFFAQAGAPAPVRAQSGPNDSGFAAQQDGGSLQGGGEAGETERLTPEDFAYVAALSLLFDIEVARLAAERAQDGAVRAFAGRFLADRQAALETLRATGAAAGTPTELDEDNRRIVDALGKEEGAEFDASFVGMTIDAMEDGIALHEEFLQAGADGPLREYVDMRIATLKSMLAEAKTLEEALDAEDEDVSP